MKAEQEQATANQTTVPPAANPARGNLQLQK